MNLIRHSTKSDDWSARALSEQEQAVAAFASSQGWMGAAQALEIVRSARDPSLRYPSWVPEYETHRALFMARTEAKRLGSYKPFSEQERNRGRFAE